MGRRILRALLGVFGVLGDIGVFGVFELPSIVSVTEFFLEPIGSGVGGSRFMRESRASWKASGLLR